MLRRILQLSCSRRGFQVGICLLLLGSMSCLQLSRRVGYEGVHLQAERFEARYLCEPPREHRVHRALFGLLTVSRPSADALFPDADVYVYRFEERKTSGDWAYSLLLGMSLSLSRGTIEVQRCLSREQAAALTPGLASEEDPFELSPGEALRVEERRRVQDRSAEARRRAAERAEAARRAAENADEN